MLKKLGLVSIATAFVLSTALFAKEDKGAKNSGERDGLTVFTESCVVCHGNKTIPETLHFGDPKDWKDLIEEGQQFPSAHGWVGTRKMPRHGGDPKITLSEFISAVAYMANNSGVKMEKPWKEGPDIDKDTYNEILKEIQIRLQRNELYDKIGKKY